MNQNDIFRNMTKGEWSLAEGRDWRQVVSEEADYAIADQAYFDTNNADMEAIVLAVNNWRSLMSKGINPEGVEKLKDALEMILDRSRNLNYTDIETVASRALNAAKL